MSKRKLTTADAEAALDKWMSLFGFAHFKRKVEPLPLDMKGKLWARCHWTYEEEYVEFQFVPDGVLERPQVEGLVLHELAHGLLDYAKEGHHPQEVVCNRIARLLLPANVQLPNEKAVAEKPWDATPSESDEVDRAILRALVDGLPEDEREVVNRRFWEHQSLSQIAGALGMKFPQDVVRVSNRATARLRRQLAAWDAIQDEEG